MLLSRDVGAVGVGIAPATVRGIRKVPFVAIQSNIALIRNPFRPKKAIMLTEEQINFGFMNTFPPDGAEPPMSGTPYPVRASAVHGYQRRSIPGRRCRSTRPSPTAPPLLFGAGGQDRVVPLRSTANYDKYMRSNADTVTAYKEFPTRSHFAAVEPGLGGGRRLRLDWARPRRRHHRALRSAKTTGVGHPASGQGDLDTLGERVFVGRRV